MSWGDVAVVLGGLVAGLISGTIGVGGGVVFVPLMTVGFRVPQTIAQGTSLLAIIPTAIVGGITHIREGNVHGDAAIWMGAGGVVGAILGALVAVHVPGQLLARVFAAVLIANAAVILRRALVVSPAESSAKQ
ncbi:MAG: uncharacterized protein QOG08_85 [Chloroflexota bacterium]|jgi:uncharacterized membrane protein YfcA|nr:uncharacterized protein [Chloroflexota bacterium]